MSELAQAEPITPSGTGTVDEAAARFERYLSNELGKQKRTKAPAAPVLEAVEEAPSVEATDASEDEHEAHETAPEGVEPEGGEAEGSNDEAENEAADDQTEPRYFTVKVDGKEHQVTEDELKAGYSRQADYTRKTEALAQERKSYNSELQKVQEERAQYAQILPALIQQWQASLPQKPDPSLIDVDPAAYLKAEKRYEAEMSRIQAAQYEYERATSAQQSDKMKEAQQYIAESFRRLPELIPAWKDPKVFERDKPRLRQYLMDNGYSEQEVDQSYDPRAVAHAFKAMKYDELMARRPRPDAPLEKALRPTPAPVPSAPRKTREAQVARTRLAKSGSVDDAALAIRSLL